MLIESLLVLSFVAARGDADPTAASPPPYRVTVDITDSIRALGSDDLFASEPAAQRIVAIGVAAVPALAAALQREPPPVRAGIADVLGRIGEPECLPPLLVAARDHSAAVRAAALGSLGPLAEPASAAVVERSLQDPDAKVRLAAVAACTELCSSEEAFARIAELAMREPSINMLPRAREVLGKVLKGQDRARAATAREAVRKTVDAQMRQASPVDVRLRAALLALDLGDRAALTPMQQAMRETDDRRLKLQAIFALANTADSQAASIVAEQAGDPLLAPAACQALRQIARKDPKAAARAHAACPPPTRKNAEPAGKKKGPGTSSPALQ